MALVAETILKKQTASARWRIGGLSLLNTDIDEKIKSGKLLECLGFKFGLHFGWGGAANEIQDLGSSWCGAWCVRLNDGPEHIRYVSQISLISQQSKADFSRSGARSSSKAKCRGWNNFKLRSEILDSHFVLDDSLILQLSIEAWPLNPKVTRLYPAAALPSTMGESSIHADLRELLRSGEGSDITLSNDFYSKAPSQQSYQAHRFVLSMRSPVFKQMLSSGMQESMPGSCVQLSGIESRVLGWLLHFIYTDEIAAEACEDDEALCHLLAAGHRYQVKALVQRCELKVAMLLSEEVAAERLVMADRLGLADLRSKILDYICNSDERLSKIQGYESFERLQEEQPQLVVDIFRRRFPRKRGRAEDLGHRSGEGCR